MKPEPQAGSEETKAEKFLNANSGLVPSRSIEYITRANAIEYARIFHTEQKEKEYEQLLKTGERLFRAVSAKEKPFPNQKNWVEDYPVIIDEIIQRCKLLDGVWVGLKDGEKVTHWLEPTTLPLPMPVEEKTEDVILPEEKPVDEVNEIFLTESERNYACNILSNGAIYVESKLMAKFRFLLEKKDEECKILKVESDWQRETIDSLKAEVQKLADKKDQAIKILGLYQKALDDMWNEDQHIRDSISKNFGTLHKQL